MKVVVQPIVHVDMLQFIKYENSVNEYIAQ